MLIAATVSLVTINLKSRLQELRTQVFRGYRGRLVQPGDLASTAYQYTELHACARRARVP
jgi:hypothetical protein